MVDYERPPRVLVVEDDDAIAHVLQRSLRMEGYEVKTIDVDDGSWDAVWEVATTVDSAGWTAEYRVPFSQLRFSSAGEQHQRRRTLENLLHRCVCRRICRAIYVTYGRTL